MAKDSKTDKDSKSEAKETKAPKAKKPGQETSELKADAKKKASDKPEGSKKGSGKPAAPRRPFLGLSQTKFAATGEIPSEWKVIDATGLPLGRMSTYIVTLLMGKHKPTYTRSVDTGDHVIVINAEKVLLTGNKWADKKYHHHTGFPGGIKTFTATELRETHPERLVEKAVYRMFPKWRHHMVQHWFGKLKVYKGDQHPHAAQKPQPVKIPYMRTERV